MQEYYVTGSRSPSSNIQTLRLDKRHRALPVLPGRELNTEVRLIIPDTAAPTYHSPNWNTSLRYRLLVAHASPQGKVKVGKFHHMRVSVDVTIAPYGCG